MLINLELDDSERIVETVPADGIAWETTGSASSVAVWLGNATEADRQAIRLAARQVSAQGQALRVSFPSVMTFLLGADGRQFRIYVPEEA
jgi:cell division inhibitor SulA